MAAADLDMDVNDFVIVGDEQPQIPPPTVRDDIEGALFDSSLSGDVPVRPFDHKRPLYESSVRCTADSTVSQQEETLRTLREMVNRLQAKKDRLGPKEYVRVRYGCDGQQYDLALVGGKLHVSALHALDKTIRTICYKNPDTGNERPLIPDEMGAIEAPSGGWDAHEMCVWW